MVKNLVATGGDGDGNLDDEGFDLIAFLDSDDCYYFFDDK
jgi:hypothetical protein